MPSFNFFTTFSAAFSIAFPALSFELLSPLAVDADSGGTVSRDGNDNGVTVNATGGDTWLVLVTTGCCDKRRRWVPCAGANAVAQSNLVARTSGMTETVTNEKDLIVQGVIGVAG